MTQDLPIQGIRPASEPPRNAGGVEPQGGAQFRALLDRLQREATSLQRDSGELEDPAALAGAVDQAGSTLSDARSLGDQLLEAYRAARHIQTQDSTGE